MAGAHRARGNFNLVDVRLMSTSGGGKTSPHRSVMLHTGCWWAPWKRSVGGAHRAIGRRVSPLWPGSGTGPGSSGFGAGEESAERVLVRHSVQEAGVRAGRWRRAIAGLSDHGRENLSPTHGSSHPLARAYRRDRALERDRTRGGRAGAGVNVRGRESGRTRGWLMEEIRARPGGGG